MDFQKYQDRLLFVPLGGSNEVGMNLNLYATQGKWLMVDCGIGFAHEYLPGVEVVVPDIEFIAERKDQLLGLVLTHAHEDHLGAVPYLWRDLLCPIYATPFTASLLRHKFAEMGPGAKPQITEVQPGAHFTLGPFEMQMIGITHSIPEMQGVFIRTAAATVMHTGDWKFDEHPLVGPVSDYARLTATGDSGVDAIVCDSTNVFIEGVGGSEEEVRDNLAGLIGQSQQRVVVTTFASNIARLETILIAAHRAGRITCLAGRSIRRMVDAAHDAGYLAAENEFVEEREIMNVPRKDALIICTGCQGEPRAALTRIARGDHPSIRLSPGDTVIYAARKIPGNDARIHHTMNQLTRKGVEMITDRECHVHVSGHPARGELKRMYEMVRPKIAIPTHGEARHLHEHAKYARTLGVKETVEAANGNVILIEPGNAGVIGQVRSGYIAVDGTSLLPADGSVIRLRRKLRDDGCALVSFCVSARGELVSPVQLFMPGVLDAQEDQELLRQLAAEIQAELESARPKSSDAQFKELAHTALRRAVKRDLDKKPVIEVAVLRVQI
ncbi:MAG: ribonuclease J [Alphaproteobacteria bacterium]|nr:ribonuclease J [Alphaproteobacteria bacterium]